MSIRTEQQEAHASALSDIARVTMEYYKIPFEKYLENKRSRKKDMMNARRLIAYITRTFFPKMPYAEIGHLIGEIGHDTVMSLCRTAKGLIETEPATKKDYNSIVTLLMDQGTIHAMEVRERVEKECFYVNLTNVKVLKISNDQAIVFSGIAEEVILKIKELLKLPQSATIRRFRNTGLAILENK